MDQTTQLTALLETAAESIRGADALLIGAGAGMGVDSGLPDFRGNEGFWKAYPPFRGRSFAEMSNPHWFHVDPEQAWGFFGHRLNLYRERMPHAGFQVLRRWESRMPCGAFVFTSNVDGHFQKAGFHEDQILECHGSIHYLQCVQLCGRGIRDAEGVRMEVDPLTIRAMSDLPRCPQCGAIARPNILMFGDFDWLPERFENQQRSYVQWLGRVRGKKLVAIELGAGLAIPTVRRECERRGTVLIRINPREAETPQGGIGLPLSALAALTELDGRMHARGQH